jgi:hypothetical protein
MAGSVIQEHVSRTQAAERHFDKAVRAAAPLFDTASLGVRCTFLSQIQHVTVTQEQIGL